MVERLSFSTLVALIFAMKLTIASESIIALELSLSRAQR